MATLSQVYSEAWESSYRDSQIEVDELKKQNTELKIIIKCLTQDMSDNCDLDEYDCKLSYCESKCKFYKILELVS